MPNIFQEQTSLEKLWRDDQLYELGQRLCELIPKEEQPVWFGKLLTYSYYSTYPTEECKNVISKRLRASLIPKQLTKLKRLIHISWHKSLTHLGKKHVIRYFPPFSTEEYKEVIEKLIEAIHYRHQWSECKEIFNELRSQNLALDHSRKPDNLKLAILNLSEKIAKVTYNNSIAENIAKVPLITTHQQHPVGFDANAGHKIPECVKNIINKSKNPKLEVTILQHILTAPSHKSQ